MSSQPTLSDNEASSHAKTKRRALRACDMCRKRKIRCEASQTSYFKCRNCVAYGWTCSFDSESASFAASEGYVHELEGRVQRLESLLRKLALNPDEDPVSEMDILSVEHLFSGDKSLIGFMSKETTNASTYGTPNILPDVRRIGITASIRGLDPGHNQEGNIQEHDVSDEPDSDLRANSASYLLHLDECRFLGPSSNDRFIDTALNIKQNNPAALPRSGTMFKNLRPEFWTPPWWEHTKAPLIVNDSPFHFPDPFLASELIDLYFTHTNLYLPLLHRISFQELVDDQRHLSDETFAAVYLLVCAVGSRYSDNPQCLLGGTTSQHSAGWKWFDQVEINKGSMLNPPRLFDLQIYALSALFLEGSSAPHLSWTMVGLGIRLAQDAGAHSRKARKYASQSEEELWKRAFWVLVCMDRMMALYLGRSCAIQDEDIDLDLPIECDDEFWDTNDIVKPFNQPGWKPSKISSFIHAIKLSRISTSALRTLYSINKSSILRTLVGDDWEPTVVSELDSALNMWMSSVPEHLQWDPHCENTMLFNQSAYLHASYYHIQILVHRPFISSPNSTGQSVIPALDICANAARSCCRIVHAQLQRTGFVPPQIQPAIFASAIMLLIKQWHDTRVTSTSRAVRNSSFAEDIQKCLDILSSSERRWHSVGRLNDIVVWLASQEVDIHGPSSTLEPSRDISHPAAASSEAMLSGIHDGQSPSSAILIPKGDPMAFALGSLDDPEYISALLNMPLTDGLEWDPNLAGQSHESGWTL